MRRIVIDKRYKILEKLGAGATGSVYKVRDLKDKKIIALKILSKKKTSSEAVQRFKREFRLLAELRHPNLCSVYDFGTLKDGRSYYTMEFIDGPNIFEFTKDLLPVRKNISNGVYSLIVQLCRALEYIHSKGLIHYDIKPNNVLIQRIGVKKLTDDVIARSPASRDDEAISKPLVNNMIAAHPSGARNDRKTVSDHSVETVVKLMDFGLVGEQRIKGGALIKGTFPYIAPELIKGLAVDHRADLYSLGVLLYAIFTRKSLQINTKSSFATLLKQSRKQVIKQPSKIVASIPKGLERIILRLLDFEPSRRLSRANEIIKEINNLSSSKFEIETEKTLEGYLLSSKFVGRNKDMGVLTSLYAKACRGEGKVVLITGDAGIGKSRLLKEFKILIQTERGHCVTGYASQGKIVPLEPFYDIFKELINYIKLKPKLSYDLKLALAVLFKIFPDLAKSHLKKKLPKLVPLEPKQEKLRMFESLYELIACCASILGELIILLEDLHWVDDLSIQFLEYLGRNLGGKNIFICGTCRKEELEENLVFKKIITNLRNKDYFTQVELRPLRFKGLCSLLDSTITPGSNSSELARYLMEKTGGNPFFVEEIMRTLLKTKGVSIGEKIEVEHLNKISIPTTIEHVVLNRVKDLDGDSQKIVKFAAVLLNDFDYDLMKHLTGFDDTELSKALWELKRRHVLIEEDNAYRLYHTTLHEAVYKRLGDKERSDLNYQIGKTLERINRQRLSKVVEDLAYYFINARNHKKGVAYGLRAAKKSSERYANEQAIKFYKGVLGLLDYKNLKRKFDILQKLAQIEALVGSYDDAIRHYNKALNLKTGIMNKKVKVYIGIAGVYLKNGQYKKALHMYQRGLRLLKKMKRSKLKTLLKIHINVVTCGIRFHIGDYKTVTKFNLDSLKFPKDDFKEEEAVELSVDIYNNMGAIVLRKGLHGKIDYNRVISYYNKVYKYSKKIKAENKIVTVLNNLGICYSYKYDYQKALDYFQKASQISEKVRDQYGILLSLLNLGIILKDRGCYSEALDCFQRTLSISKKIGNPSMTGGSLMGLGACFLELCNYKESKEYTEKALKVFNAIGWKDEQGFLIRGIGNTYRAMGDYTFALRLYRKALKISKDIMHQRQVAYLLINISSVLIEIGEFLRAKRYIEEALKMATAFGWKNIKIDCYIILCRNYIMTGDYVVASDYCKGGIRMADELGTKPQLLQFLLLVSDIYYHEKRYVKGSKFADKAIKLAKKMRIKDLYTKALLMKVKNGVKQGVLSKIEAIKTLNEAKKIAEEIGNPEVLWKIYFEYGKFFHNDKQYPKALEYYQNCNRIFGTVISKIKNKSYKKSYLNRPDRQAIYVAKNEIKRLLP